MIDIASLSRKNSTFREFTNKIFDILRREEGVSAAAGVLETFEDEIRDLFDLGKTAKETIELIQQTA